MKGTLLDSVPPHDLPAEAAVIGSVILDRDNRCMAQLATMLRPEDFYRRSHQLLYAAQERLFYARKPIDLVTLRDDLEHQGALADAGGVEYLTDLCETVPSAANALEYAGIVGEKARLRQLLAACTEAARRAYEPDAQSEALAETLHQTLAGLHRPANTDPPRLIGNVLLEAFNGLQEGAPVSKGEQGILTGFADIDHATQGLQKGEVAVLAGDTSSGKSTLALNIAAHIAARDSHVLFFTIEMTARKLAERLLAAEARLALREMTQGLLAQSIRQKIRDTAKRLMVMPMYVSQRAPLKPSQLRAEILLAQDKAQLALVVVDYLQLMARDERKREGEHMRLTSICRALGATAKEFGVPILLLCQLNRTPGKLRRKPTLADLRGSGTIEEDASVVMLIYRPERVGTAAQYTELAIAKNRHGPCGVVYLAFIADQLRFEQGEAGIAKTAKEETPAWR